VGQGDCPAIYIDDDDPVTMVGQGRALDERAAGELQNRADDEMG
jgi:hypothetical protein